LELNGHGNGLENSRKLTKLAFGFEKLDGFEKLGILLRSWGLEKF
jgi:hypothetical protein